ncbi:MAG: ATP-binding protein [bacterium]
MNIRIRFLIWFNFASFVIILLFSTITFLSVVHSIEEGINNRLNSVAEATVFIIQRSDIPISCGSKDFSEMLEAFLGYKDTEGYVKIISSENKVLSCTQHVLTEKINLSDADLKKLKEGEKIIRDYKNTVDYKEKRIRVLFYPVFREDRYMGYLEVGSSLSKLENMERSLLHIFLIVIPVVLAVANIGGFIIFNKSFSPIIMLSNEMKHITAHHLYKRLPELEGDDEIATLYRSINDMIARLEKSFEQIKQFSGDASHELRTPLTIIKGEVELALRSERSKEEYQEILASILEEIERMTNIVENLLLLAKSEAGDILIDKKPINIREIILGLCDQLEMYAENKNVKLIYEELQDGVVNGDMLRLRQVFTNLIVNAIKYNVEGGKVVVKVVDSPNGVLTVVEDTGIGIKREEIPKIFDRFYRSDKSRTRSEGGAGLGLSICKSIVEAHGGYIDVESEFGRGSKFSVWIPKISD